MLTRTCARLKPFKAGCRLLPTTACTRGGVLVELHRETGQLRSSMNTAYTLPRRWETRADRVPEAGKLGSSVRSDVDDVSSS